MRALLLLVVATSVGCAGTWGESRTLNVATASAAAVGMALDWCGTRHAAETRTDAWEGGMPTSRIIGTSPSAHAVDAYFAVGTVALAAAAQLVPRRYRWIAYGAVAAGELVTVHDNLSTTRCGPIGTN